MEIKIKRTGSETFTGNLHRTVNTYMVIEDGREFILTRTSHMHGSSIGIADREGTLYLDSDDNRVHHQSTVPGGACGLNTDDEVVEGLSPLTLRAVLMVDQCNESGEITVTTKQK